MMRFLSAAVAFLFVVVLPTTTASDSSSDDDTLTFFYNAVNDFVTIPEGCLFDGSIPCVSKIEDLQLYTDETITIPIAGAFLDAVCDTVSPGVIDCTFVVETKDGNINFEGSITIFDETPDELTVTGGTDEYEDAVEEGSVVLESLGNADKLTFTDLD